MLYQFCVELSDVIIFTCVLITNFLYISYLFEVLI